MIGSDMEWDGKSPEELEIYKRLAIVQIEQWFEGIPEHERDEPALLTQEGEWTPRQIVEEVHAFSEQGRRIAWMLDAVRQDLSKKEE